jgi:hypothetical protein
MTELHDYDVTMTGRFTAESHDAAYHLALGDLYSLDVAVEQVRDSDLDDDDPILVERPDDDALNER